MDQCGFFTANESTGAQANGQVEIKTGTKDVLAQQAVGTGLVNGDLQTADRQRVLRANIYIALVRADSISRDGHAFDHTV